MSLTLFLMILVFVVVHNGIILRGLITKADWYFNPKEDDVDIDNATIKKWFGVKGIYVFSIIQILVAQLILLFALYMFWVEYFAPIEPSVFEN